MIRAAGSLFKPRAVAAGVATIGAGGVVYVATADNTLGIRRQGEFWLRVMPVVADYYWHLNKNSPYVQYMKWRQETARPREKVMEELHEKHAPEIFQIMLDLKGLYIKLGQVLSVTALPIPEPYRARFRTLQSEVPGWEEFESVVKPILEEDLAHGQSLRDIFDYVDPTPCGAASIGQAHRATLKATGQEVIVKVQYPSAAWQVPADIQCVGDFTKLCVWAGVVDEAASRLSFEDFSRQFLAELDYRAEQRNLETIHASSVDPKSPYRKHGVLVPEVYPDLCTDRVISMSFLPGVKLEEEARRQLEMLGVDTKRGLRSIVSQAATETEQPGSTVADSEVHQNFTSSSSTVSRMTAAGRVIGRFIGIDSLLWMTRLFRQVVLWPKAITVQTIRATSSVVGVPKEWDEWAELHQVAVRQAQRVNLTRSWIDALMDVHGHQIFDLGLFNADCHPGNILIVEDGENASSPNQTLRKPSLGLIDFGQCKQLNMQERARVARLVLSVANKESNEHIATAFRELGVQTRNDSTVFLAEMAKLMFGQFETAHLDHRWHRKLHDLDRITYFPTELSMVYRTALLLRGLAASLQINANIGEHWKKHAETSVKRAHARVQVREGEAGMRGKDLSPIVREVTAI